MTAASLLIRDFVTRGVDNIGDPLLGLSPGSDSCLPEPVLQIAITNTIVAHAMQDIGETPLVCQRCLKGPSFHGGHRRQDPNCLLHGCTSHKTKDIQDFIKQKQIEQAFRKALESPQQATAEPSAIGNAPLAATSSTARTPPPSPPPLRRNLVDNTAVAQKSALHMTSRPKMTWTSMTNRKPSFWTLSASSSASTPMKGNQPPGLNTEDRALQCELSRARQPTSMSSRGTTSSPDKKTANTQAAETMPEWSLPQLPRFTTSRVIRGPTPIEAGAALAIPASAPTTTARPSETGQSSSTGKPPKPNSAFMDDTINYGEPHPDLEADSLPPTVDSHPTTTTRTTPGDKPGTSPTTTGASDTTLRCRGPDLNFEAELPVPAEKSPRPSQELPSQDFKTILEPLPPGWVPGQGFTKGLHPSADVFADEAEQPKDALQQRACDKGDVAVECDAAVPESEDELGDDPPCEKRSPSSSARDHGDSDPDAPTSPVCSENEGDENEGERPQAEAISPADAVAPEKRWNQDARAGGVTAETYRGSASTPTSAPSTTRLRWECGLPPPRAPHRPGKVGRLYRKTVREQYRAYRKRKRADGTWDKDDHRWRPPQRWTAHPVPERPPPPRSRDRSPLPRRRTPARDEQSR